MPDWDFIEPQDPRAPRIKIYDGTPTPEGMIALRLIELGPNEIMLAVVDDSGEVLVDPLSEAHAAALLTVTDRHIIPAINVMPSLGFDLDVHGCVRSDPDLEALKAKRSQNFGGKRAAFRSVT